MVCPLFKNLLSNSQTLPQRLCNRRNNIVEVFENLSFCSPFKPDRNVNFHAMLSENIMFCWYFVYNLNVGTGSDFPSGAPVLTSIFSRVRVTQYLVLYVVCWPLFVFLFLFHWPLYYWSFCGLRFMLSHWYI
jgi:hypothetical protein